MVTIAIIFVAVFLHIQILRVSHAVHFIVKPGCVDEPQERESESWAKLGLRMSSVRITERSDRENGRQKKGKFHACNFGALRYD